MRSDETPSRYPYLISVRGGRPVPARRDGSYYVCAYQTFLGLWWPPREVRVLEYDPHRDFYREQRQAQQADKPDATDAVAPVAGSPAAAVGPDANGDTPVWERVGSPSPQRPAPPSVRIARTPRGESGGDEHGRHRHS